MGIVDPVNGMPVHCIDSAQALARAAEGWMQRPVLALDTEFMRVRTYYAQAALFQLCDGEACYLIDPLAVRDLAPLAQALTSPAIVKVMHSCSEDLEVCERYLGALPEPLIDSQIVAAFCGHGLSVGYQKMLAQELGVALEKSETRTDWLQRPLSASQLRYAAEDVAYLPALWAKLAQRLAAVPAGAWAREECTAVLERFRERDTANAYRNIGGAWRLDGSGLAVLRALCDWRERTARDKDLPRNWVVPDAALLQIAQLKPVNAQQLESLSELQPGSRRRFGSEILSAVGTGLGSTDLPAPVPAPPTAAQGRLVKALRAQLVQRGASLGIAPEMLARRRDLEELLRWRADAAPTDALGLMRGWRRSVIGEELLRLTEGWVA